MSRMSQYSHRLNLILLFPAHACAEFLFEVQSYATCVMDMP